MRVPEEQEQSIVRGVAEGWDVGGTGIELAADGIFAVGDFLGQAFGGILDSISIDI